ncbi:MAG: alpha-L-fucosidase [Candidatus Delongbacteria bacterium]|nr:alpha-L-fucosidase [Candidatus Delongbacteria bacterium]MBN2836801.1 alpha-L-fucosidase [Candidatus Delongbacteria bacterium]
MKIILALILLINILALAYNENYHEPKDDGVREKISEWQDYKFGLMMHWGPYSQWGVMESWTICSEDWIGRDLGRFENYSDYLEDYENLQRTFNPFDYNPEKWVNAAKNAGMKYVVFTTKHHDGFCMFDTKTTDYKITSKKTPFSIFPQADVTKSIFDAFRKENFWIGAYFSKPDWHCEDYWWSFYPKGSRHVNYDPKKHPEKWENYKKFTYTQIEELMTNYGDIDILWLDGAWVRPRNNTPDQFKDWAITKDYDQDIDMPKLAEMARSHQPNLIIVDRWVEGEYENYLTPENKVPDKALLVPWEACVPMAGGWSYNKRHEYKTTEELIKLLVNVVSKGGNLLLNIGPSPYGDWDPIAYERLDGIANWMKINSEGIYNSKVLEPYKENNICFTKGENGEKYLFYICSENEKVIPDRIKIISHCPDTNEELTLLGYDKPLEWNKNSNGECEIVIPENLKSNPPSEFVWTFKISKK